ALNLVPGVLGERRQPRITAGAAGGPGGRGVGHEHMLRGAPGAMPRLHRSPTAFPPRVLVHRGPIGSAPARRPRPSRVDRGRVSSLLREDPCSSGTPRGRETIALRRGGRRGDPGRTGHPRGKGTMRSNLFDAANQERQTTDRWTLQSSKMLRCSLTPDAPEIISAAGAMVAYQGQMDFSYQGSGGGMKLLKKMATGEGGNMMRTRGHGEIFYAHQADEIFLIQLEGEALTLNTTNMLAFDSSIQ